MMFVKCYTSEKDKKLLRLQKLSFQCRSHHWQSRFALIAGRRKVLGSISGCTCRPSFRSFLRNSSKYGIEFLRKSPVEGTLPTGPGPTNEQLTLI